MDVPSLVGVAGLMGLLFIASRVVAGRPGFLGDTFFRDRFREAWPAGVQEDDDFSWRWRAGQARRDPPPPRLLAVRPDPDEAAPAVAVQRLHGEVRRR